MIQIIPSRAILNGKIIRLKQGNYANPTEYEDSPVDLARKFEDHGIKVLHLVDLDGAKKGSPVNYHVLEAIAGHTGLKVDFTGGIHTDGDISKAYEYGASYITAASLPALNRELFVSWLISYGREKITMGADSVNGKIAIRGWQKNTDIDLLEHISYFYERGLKFVKTTDIARDGLMEGPTFSLYEKVMEKCPGIQILASGGVRQVDDIKQLDEMGMFAVIIGRALYENKINLSELEQFLAKPA